MTTLARKRRLVAATLIVERLVPAMLPAAAIACAFLCAALLGLPSLLPGPIAAAVLALCLAAFVALAVHGARRLRRPTEQEVDRRLERNGNTPHHPLATLKDRPAWDGGEAIWAAHRQHALATAETLRPGLPRLAPRSAAAAAALLALPVLSILVAGPSAAPHLWAALTPSPWPEAAPLQLRAWIVPPASTGLGPIFLRPEQQAAVAVPAGSVLTVSASGAGAAPRFAFADHRQRFATLEPGVFQARITLRAGGTLLISRQGTRIARWPLAVAPDARPVIHLAGAASVDGPRLRLPWTASDDYGLAGMAALIAHPGQTPIRIELPLAGQPRAAKGAGLPDLTALPWAGLPVTVAYIARDGGGQTGSTDPVSAILPERAFKNPLARALVLVRKSLATDPSRAQQAAAALDDLAAHAATRLTLGQWLNLRAIADGLSLRQHPHPDRAGTLERLWQLATQIEDGGRTQSKQRLADARKALADALAANAPSERLEQLNRELQQAMHQYLQTMGAKPRAPGDQAPQANQQNGREIEESQLQRMAKDLADAARAGRTAEAQSKLQQLGAMLDQLKQAEQGRSQAQGSQPQKPDPELSSLLHDQLGLRQHSDQRLADDADPRAANSTGRDPDEAAGQPDPAAQRDADAQAQQDLRRRLGALASRLGEQAGKVPDGLAKADGAMRQAQSALTAGDDAGARAAQQRALDGLRAGGQQGQQAGNGQGGTQPGAQPGQAKGGTDPFGRSTEEGGRAMDDGDRATPVNADTANGRAVRDELRRRASDRTRPQPELDYIDRLLKSQ